MSHAGRYKPRKVLELECYTCENKFQATRPDARYCSATCRKKVSRSMLAVKRLKKVLFSTNAPQAAAKLAGDGTKPKR